MLRGGVAPYTRLVEVKLEVVGEEVERQCVIPMPILDFQSENNTVGQIYIMNNSDLLLGAMVKRMILVQQGIRVLWNTKRTKLSEQCR